MMLCDALSGYARATQCPVLMQGIANRLAADLVSTSPDAAIHLLRDEGKANSTPLIVLDHCYAIAPLLSS
eukprot:2254297-Rhodomonas_salina.2